MLNAWKCFSAIWFALCCFFSVLTKWQVIESYWILLIVLIFAKIDRKIYLECKCISHNMRKCVSQKAYLITCIAGIEKFSQNFKKKANKSIFCRTSHICTLKSSLRSPLPAYDPRPPVKISAYWKTVFDQKRAWKYEAQIKLSTKRLIRSTLIII